MLRRAALALMTLAASSAHAAAWQLVSASEGFTFAFAEREGAREAFLVVAAGDESVTAVALGTPDAFAALAERGEEAVAALLADGPRTELPVAALLPVIVGGRHVAAGANYAEHADEAEVPAPFLFPKLAEPTPWQASLAVQPGWLLDYEVELGVVFDRDLASPADLASARAGVFVANDFTERAQLTREADLSVPGVGGGFANAKGKPGFLPTGPFLVVPKDWRAFVRDCEIRLHVNGAERQRDRGASLLWDVDEIVRRVIALGDSPRFVHAGRSVALTPGRLPRGMALVTGTPGGVVFRPPGAGFIALQAAWWAVSLGFLDTDAESAVKEAWVEELLEQGAFLRAGDTVIAEGRGLGAIVTQVVAP
jgi:2-keto-4-pentenoate hydratase/2-oxohepta-3-ene-1,7-dioic acid hydratase in catechol pathway